MVYAVNLRRYRKENRDQLQNEDQWQAVAERRAVFCGEKEHARNGPREPPRIAMRKRVRSGIRHFPNCAFLLSIPIEQNPIRLKIIHHPIKNCMRNFLSLIWLSPL